MVLAGERMLVEFLRRHGPCSSHEYYDYAESKGIPRDRTRAQVRRIIASNRVKTLNSVSLRANRNFLFLEEHRNTVPFFKALMEVGSAYGWALHGVMLRGGAVSEAVFDVTCGSPVAHRKKHIRAKTLRERLLEDSLLEQENGLIHLPNVSPTRWHVAKREVEGVLLGLLSQWLKRNGFVSYGKVSIRGESAPDFAGFAWDLTAPSYISALREVDGTGKLKPGFVVADVHVERFLGLGDVRYFVRKCNAIRSVRSNRPFIPFLVAPGFHADAWKLGRKEGYQFVTLKTLLGEDVEESLGVLLTVISTKSLEALDSEAQLKLLKSFKRIGFDEGRVRGLLFELLAITLLAHDGKPAYLGHPIAVPAQSEADDDEVVEPDVVVNVPGRLTFIECKGFRTDELVYKATIEDWLNRRIPRLQRWADELDKHHSWNRRRRFEFWTTSFFEPNALEVLKSSKLPISWRDRDSLESFMEDVNLSTRYLKHFDPLGSTSAKKRPQRVEVPQGLGGRLEKLGLSAEIPLFIEGLKGAMKSGALSPQATADECLEYVLLQQTRAKFLVVLKQRRT